MKSLRPRPNFVAPLSVVMRLRFAQVMLGVVTCTALTTGSALGQDSASPSYTMPLATGVRLDPVGRPVELGNLPLAIAAAPRGGKAAVVLSGFRQQGLQIVDLASGRVTQTLEQPGNVFGRRIARNHNLFLAVVQLIERMEKFFLRALLIAEKLNVVDEQHIGGPVALAQLRHALQTDAGHHFIGEALTRSVDNPHTRAVGHQRPPDRVH